MPITLEQFHAGMLEIGGPLIADVFTEICRETLDGHNAYLTDGVQRALGRAPRDFADFCHNVAASGAWKQSGLIGDFPSPGVTDHEHFCFTRLCCSLQA
jgi:hypothetical protein